MNANETHLGGPESQGKGSRLMLVLAEGCRICVSLDSVEGVFERSAAPDAVRQERAEPPGSPPLRVVSWGELVGVPAPADAVTAAQVLVVRTSAGKVGLAIDACLGVRDANFLDAPVLPTGLTDAAGEPLCFVHLIDRRPHFILDPRALAATRAVAVGLDAADSPSREPASGDRVETGASS